MALRLLLRPTGGTVHLLVPSDQQGPFTSMNEGYNFAPDRYSFVVLEIRGTSI